MSSEAEPRRRMFRELASGLFAPKEPVLAALPIEPAKPVQFGRRSFMQLASGLLVPIEEYVPEISYVFVHKPDDPNPWAQLSYEGQQLLRLAAVFILPGYVLMKNAMVAGPGDLVAPGDVIQVRAGAP